MSFSWCQAVQFKRWLSCIILFCTLIWNLHCQFLYSFTEQVYESSSNGNSCISCLYFFFLHHSQYPSSNYFPCQDVNEEVLSWLVTWHTFPVSSKVDLTWGFLWTVIVAAVPVMVWKCILIFSCYRWLHFLLMTSLRLLQ